MSHTYTEYEKRLGQYTECLIYILSMKNVWDNIQNIYMYIEYE